MASVSNRQSLTIASLAPPSRNFSGLEVWLPAERCACSAELARLDAHMSENPDLPSRSKVQTVLERQSADLEARKERAVNFSTIV